jgi:hypothetical protein
MRRAILLRRSSSASGRKHIEGFGENDLELIQAVLPAVALAIMSDAEHTIAAELLAAYLGARRRASHSCRCGRTWFGREYPCRVMILTSVFQAHGVKG